MRRIKRNKSKNQLESTLDQILSQSPSLSRSESRITFDMGRGLMIEGVKSICEYTGERLIVSTYSKSIIVEGCDLCIGCMLYDAILICGCISCIKFL